MLEQASMDTKNADTTLMLSRRDAGSGDEHPIESAVRPPPGRVANVPRGQAWDPFEVWHERIHRPRQRR